MDKEHELIINLEGLQIQFNVSLEMQLVKILDTQVKGTRNKHITLVKVQWNGNDHDVTWDIETEMRDKYPHFFEHGDV